MTEKIKVISYVFRTKNGVRELLVFLHRDFPEAGLQVVGGTVEAGEEFKTALTREILEESGLHFTESQMTKIGETTYQRKDRPEVNFRHYYAIESQGLPEVWSHIVKSSGADNDLVFDFYWMTFDEAKKSLTGNFGELLP